MMDWLSKISLGEWLTAGVLCASVAGWGIRQHVRMNRAAELAESTRDSLNAHLEESEGLVQRFIVLESHGVEMDRRLNDLLVAVRLDRSQAREDRKEHTEQIMNSISELRGQVDARMTDLRELIYSTVADRRKA